MLQHLFYTLIRV